MRKLDRGPEPPELTSWKKRNTSKLYKDIDHEERQAINEANIKLQHGLCGYCCMTITPENSMNEHLEPRSTSHIDKQLDFDNIIASCKTVGQCDSAHKNQDLPLTPYMDECETELKFYASGRVIGNTARGTKTIEVLNLDNRSLRNKRKLMIDALLYGSGTSPEDLELLDEISRDIILDDLKQLDENNNLQPYSPVLANILSQVSL